MAIANDFDAMFRNMPPGYIVVRRDTMGADEINLYRLEGGVLISTMKFASFALRTGQVAEWVAKAIHADQMSLVEPITELAGSW